ncbi:coiled-coil domain-containing protein 81-like isoform X2 [Passer domesticus]|uniref:coiled-coil domain-containing protein 81-like isoform X2 n=1 Tax=Passer domesticus TaxID=48849 RepID=UPI0030FE9993
MQKYLLYNAVEPEDLPTLKELSTIEICKVWSGMSRQIYRQLLKKKAVEIGIGSFVVIPVHANVAEGKVLPVERPMFILSKTLKLFYNLESDEIKIPDEIPVVQPDFEEIAANTHFRHEIVEQCVQETLLYFAGALRDNKEVEFTFRSIGILAVRKKVVSMTFFDNCLLEMDSTGNMLKALLEDPNMMSTVAFPGQNKFSRVSQDEVVTLPSFVAETPHQPLARLVSLKPRRESAPWGGGCRRVSVLDPVFLARRRVSQASQQSMEMDHTRDKEIGHGGYLPVIHEKTHMMLKHPTPPDQQGLKVSASTTQPSEAGRHPLYTEKEERELQLLLASKRHEVEADVYRKYFGNRAVTERGQTSCPYVFEDPYRPSHILRKAYAEKLKEMGQSASERQAESQLSRKVLEERCTEESR